MKEERLTLISCNDLGWYPTRNFKYLVFIRTEKYVAYCIIKEVCIMARGTGQNYICQNIYNSSVKYNTTFQIYKELL